MSTDSGARDLAFEARELSRVFGHGRHAKTAVNAVSFEIRTGEIASIVGESGCGKTVLARMLLRLEKPSSGQLFFAGRPIDAARDPREHFRHVQAVFQDPFSAFNQFFTIRSQLASAFRLFPERPSRAEMDDRIDRALLGVNIEPREIEGKYPFELSGGQMQRMLLARVFIIKPRVLVADEPTSMVDASSRASILEYLMKLKQELDMTIVFVTHDIGLAYYTSDSLLIMHQGKIVEQGPPDRITRAPQARATRQLLEDIPDVNRDWLARQSSDQRLSSNEPDPER